MLNCENYIAGSWRGAPGGDNLESRNPATGDLVCTAPIAPPDQVLEAIAAARTVFEAQLKWREDPVLRGRVLLRYAADIRREIKRLARLLTDENGKTIPDAYGELARGADIVEYYGTLAMNIHGKALVPAPNLLSIVLREPIGVVTAVIPYNFPVVLMLRALAPALAAGNAVIVKPSEYTSGITYVLVKLLFENSDLPSGMVQLLAGGASVGAELARNPEVDMISFTGSTTVGREVMKLASQSLKKVSLELGGKSPNIVFKDANYKKAIQYALRGAWLSFGSQVCYAGTRILLEQSLHDEFLQSLKEEAERMRLGYGADEGVDIGPVISRKQMDRVMQYIEVGKRDAKLVTGGYRAEQGDLAKGFFVAPTVFDEIPADSAIGMEEIFGPVLSVFTFKDLDEAAEIANRTSFGLAAAVWTDNINKALTLAKRTKSGTVWINSYGKLPPQAEMEGHKQSGMGTQYGEEGLYEYTQFKHIAIEISD